MRKWQLVIFPISISLMVTPTYAWEPINDEKTCAIGDSWELGSTIVITKRIDVADSDLMDDEVYMAIMNENWSLASGDESDFTLKFEADDGSWLSNTPIALENGLLISTELKYLENFSFVSSMAVYKEKDKIAQLNWSGFYSGLSKLKQCIDKARAPIIERKRLESIRKTNPLDPFAKK